jgi:hypothetical protein
MIYDSLEISKVLVIAPLRVARSTWPEEIEKWEHLKDLEYSVVVGDKKTRIAALNTQAQIYLVNREMVQWVVSYYTENGYTWISI